MSSLLGCLDHRGAPGPISVAHDRGGGVAAVDKRAESAINSGGTHCVTSPNSVGNGAIMEALGSLSVDANSFTLGVHSAMPVQFGLFSYGRGQTQVLFGEEFRCLDGGGTGLFRIPAVRADAFGGATWHLDFTRHPADSGPGQITGGSTWNVQFWYRDPSGGPAGFNLSDGLEVTFCP